MPHADVNGQRIFFEDSGGGGLPVVLAHGLLMDREMFAPQVAALAGRHRVVTWDERGHGLTEATPDEFTYWDSAEDLRALLDHLGIERAVIGGMSQGGFISLRFALRHPERVIGLILLNTQAGPEDPEATARYDGMHDYVEANGLNDLIANGIATAIIGPDRPESRVWMEKWKARPRGEARRLFRTLTGREDLTDRLGEITAAAVVVHGEEDSAIPIARAETLAGSLPGARPLVRVPGAAHASNLTHPELVNEAIESFLADLE
jgi:pimeloyl-ACP methyl ester carboxylesterase